MICQDHKDFNNEIKNIRHALMLNEYLQGFVDSIMKPSGSNRPSSDTIYQCTASISCVKRISDTFRRTGNRFNLRKNGTLMKTSPVKRCPTDETVCVQYPM
jgi:hypothetical protein